ncbi:UNVERIFIED_CONTAM: hypothetical protein PYX00_004557 [Menopon gallinae]|uniref:Solute carrier family 35 member F6 n=1 Tax=Menopon gallinae TaxID=328185 RepID=A0AAW2I664_9NEOP
MAWTPYQLTVCIVLVITGSINTLTTKWADRIESEGRDGEVRNFNHPFVQSLAMFLGEMLCLLGFKIIYFYYKKKDNSQDERTLVRGSRNFKISIFFLPAMCDLFGTSIVYIGLTMTNASSFQMLRGSLIIFVVLLSVGFLNRKVNSREWTGIITIILGLVIVGLSDFYVAKDRSFNSVITGDLLIILGQIVTATQIVLEEYFVAGQDIPPLQAVGWEGTFGFSVLGMLLVPLSYIHVGRPFSTSPGGALEDVQDALVQMQNNHLLIICIIGTIVSIGFFNFCGISVTKELSGTTRTVLDSVRTFVIWLMTIALGWEKFSFLQVIGFFLLVMGMFIYNDILITRGIRSAINWYTSRPTTVSHESLINQAADETNP